MLHASWKASHDVLRHTIRTATERRVLGARSKTRADFAIGQISEGDAELALARRAARTKGGVAGRLRSTEKKARGRAAAERRPREACCGGGAGGGSIEASETEGGCNSSRASRPTRRETQGAVTRLMRALLSGAGTRSRAGRAGPLSILLISRAPPPRRLDCEIGARAAPLRPRAPATQHRRPTSREAKQPPVVRGAAPSCTPAAQSRPATQTDRWPMEQSMDAEALDEPSLLLPRAGGVSPPTTPRRPRVSIPADSTRGAAPANCPRRRRSARASRS